MKVSTQNPALYEAMKKVMERSPGLVTDGSRVRDVAGQLAAQGMSEAALVAKASPAEVAEIRKRLIADVFSKQGPSRTDALTGGTSAKGEKPTVVVGGGSYSGMLAAMRAAQKGANVVILESRPEHTRDLRLSIRQGMLDTLAAIDPELAARVIAKASKMSPENMQRLMIRSDGRQDWHKLTGHGSDEPHREPDASKKPGSGKELMETPYRYVAIARELEGVIEEYVREKFPSSITFLEGALKAEKQNDGTFKFQLERRLNDGTSITEDFLKGKKPMAVFAAEGSNSSTRRALEIEHAPTTPVQYWTAGVVKTIDTSVPLGEASLRSMYKHSEVTDAAGVKQTVLTRAAAISDGREGTWLLTEMPPFYNPDPALAQEEINRLYLDAGCIVTGHTREHLEEAGIAGPIAKPGSVPTAFALQGKAAREAARVLPDGVVVGLLGDSVMTSSFQAGGGMNTAITESDTVAKLIEDLQRGVEPHVAAASYQSDIFERGTAWSAAGIPFFYGRMSPEKSKLLVQGHLQAIADWRREGGPSPIERLEALLNKTSVATEPLGPKLAA